MLEKHFKKEKNIEDHSDENECADVKHKLIRFPETENYETDYQQQREIHTFVIITPFKLLPDPFPMFMNLCWR
jgi:hypothetical protein